MNLEASCKTVSLILSFSVFSILFARFIRVTQKEELIYVHNLSERSFLSLQNNLGGVQISKDKWIVLNDYKKQTIGFKKI